MTNQPHTAAGRALSRAWRVRRTASPGLEEAWPDQFDRYILAIEAEAAAPALDEAAQRSARREAGLREALGEVVDALQEWRDSEIVFPGRRLSKALDKARLASADEEGTGPTADELAELMP